MFKKAILSVFVLVAVSACAHKAGKGHDCASCKAEATKCEGGHCASDANKEKSGCAECKEAGGH
jgi:hypothetical protein